MAKDKVTTSVPLDDIAPRPVLETLDALGVDVAAGLTQAAATDRLRQYGYNEISEHEESLAHRIFRRFWGPIPWMIELAAILSAVVRKWEDFAIIMVMLLVNAFLDFFQEHRALSALKALKEPLANEAIVRRDGNFRTILAREIVPGNIIKLKIGDVIPAMCSWHRVTTC
jgi:H+-transporting ATPase